MFQALNVILIINRIFSIQIFIDTNRDYHFDRRYVLFQTATNYEIKEGIIYFRLYMKLKKMKRSKKEIYERGNLHTLHHKCIQLHGIIY